MSKTRQVFCEMPLYTLKRSNLILEYIGFQAGDAYMTLGLAYVTKVVMEGVHHAIKRLAGSFLQTDGSLLRAKQRAPCNDGGSNVTRPSP